jgi:two-component system, NtrC family, sensor histidine kinase PilS
MDLDLNSSHSPDSPLKTLKSVKGLMLSRLIILTLLLAITFLFQISEKKYFFIPLTNAFYYFIGFFYLVTIIYALSLRNVKDLRRFIFVQMVLDYFFITVLIYFTGGKQSYFPIAYIFAIIGSSITFYKRGAFLSASLAAVLYGLLLLFQLYGWINPQGQSVAYEASQVFYTLIIYMATFYIVAFLSGYISEELKKKKSELIQKQSDYNRLETFNRNIIQSLDSSLLTTDLEGKINFLNRTAEKILNLNGQALGNVSIYDLFPRVNSVIDEMKRNPAHPASDYRRCETPFVNHQGRSVYLGFSISPLTGPDGALIGYTLIFQDITKFKELEEQMKRYDKMSAINQLAAGMAHEIRNPLTSLSGSIQMLQSELTLDAHQQRLMNIVLRESERLNRLITDFLLFAQPPRTNKSLSTLNNLIEETIELLTNSHDYHEGIEIQVPESNENFQIMADPHQMRQVFWNLFINAVQAIGDRGKLIIRMAKEENSPPTTALSPGVQGDVKEWVKVSVTDSGHGIPPQEKEKIFEPFYSTKDRGTGLGLSIVHNIVENHNGIIKVESEVGKGSTFTVLLPALQEKERIEC